MTKSITVFIPAHEVPPVFPPFLKVSFHVSPSFCYFFLIVMETEDNLFVNEVNDCLVGDEITEFLALVAPLIEEEAARSIDDRTRHTVLPSQFFFPIPHPSAAAPAAPADTLYSHSLSL